MADIDLNGTLADAVLARPWEFFVNSERFCLWAPTLGMSMLLADRINALDADSSKLRGDVYMEALKLSVEKREEVCDIISLSSFRDYVEICNSRTVKKRSDHFAQNLTSEELAQLLLLIFTAPKVETIIEEVGLANQQKRQSEIASYKNKSWNTITFGGLTIYGTLIAPACEKFGWTKEYVVWGIDLISLRMMLADSVNSVHLTDEDKKGLGKAASKEKFNLTQEDIDRIKRDYDWS